MGRSLKEAVEQSLNDAQEGGSSETTRRCGLVAIVGRPNVGKSTLLNALVGQKISITSSKAQTTRHRITGIRTVDEAQFIFVDTPGFQTRHGAALNRTLNRTVQGVLSDVDVVLFVVEAGRFGLDDAKVLALLQAEGLAGKPVILVANKLDTVHRRAELAPWLQAMPSPSSCRWPPRASRMSSACWASSSPIFRCSRGFTRPMHSPIAASVFWPARSSARSFFA
jgi:small GTP-binding protein